MKSNRGEVDRGVVVVVASPSTFKMEEHIFMGITLGQLGILRQKGMLKPGSNILDIGSSNLYSACREEIVSFLAHYGVEADASFIDRIAAGSAYGENGGVNGSFVGEMLEKAGMTYLAFDIADGFRTQIFDLNHETIPRKLAGSFDLVLNFGTTEHVINQLNSFRVIHDAAKVGGIIVNAVPSVGYLDHGYFCYTPRFFFDLAGYNAYEVIDFHYSEPVPGNDIFGIVRDYVGYFPALANCISIPSEATNMSLFIATRKMVAAPLKIPMETSTSVVRARHVLDAPRKTIARLFGRG